MEQYINKADIVAETERLKNVFVNERDDFERGYHNSLNTISDFLDTLEVKEINSTDAFIEKALKFLDEKFYFNNLHYCIESGVFDSEEEMFEDFKNYMKGE